MNDLIEALAIFQKYMAKNVYAPTHCEHDVLCVCGGIELGKVDPADIVRLEKLGFFWSNEYDCFASYRFGSC